MTAPHRCAGRSLYWDARAPLNRTAAQERQDAFNALATEVRKTMTLIGETLRPMFETARDAFLGLTTARTAFYPPPPSPHGVGRAIDIDWYRPGDDPCLSPGNTENYSQQQEGPDGTP